MDKKGEFKMKKISLLVLVSMLLLLVFSSCTLLFDTGAGNNNEHVHAFGEEWSYNSTKHYHACECGEKDSLADHVDEEGDDGKCDVCGYQVSEPVVTPVYTVTVGTVANATVSATTYEVNEGDDVVITVTVDEGYSLTAVGAVVDGEPTVNDDGKTVYTLKVSDVKANVTVTLTTAVIVPTCQHDWTEADCNTAKTCKVCGETEGDKLGHSWTPASCTAPNTCSRCGETYGSILPHVEGTAATCTSPAICQNCEQPYGEKAAHTWKAADCENAKTCKVCGETEGEALGHNWKDADCDNAKTCRVCGETEGEALGHDWAAPTCTMPGYCKTCGNIGEDATGHSYSDATCTEPQICSACGNKNGNALGHSWVDATCTEDGYCSVCNEAGDKATGHKHVLTSTTAATCTVDGVKHYECSCGDSYDEVIEAAGHKAGPEADCENDQVCTVCGELLAEKLGHNYTSSVVEPTCVKAGYTLHVCENCGHSYTDNTVLALGHTPGSEATCTAPQLCTVCNAVIVDALGHDYTSDVTAPKCTEGGYTTYTCTVCGYSYQGDETAATGHSYTSAVTPPTCDEVGGTRHTCTVCGDYYTDDPVPALGHTPGAAATCTDDQICTVCNKVVTPAFGHTGGAEATCETAQICTVCNAVVVDALGHAWSAWTDNGNGTHSHVCGNDASHIETADHEWTEATYSAAAECSACGLVGEPLYHELVLGENDIISVSVDRNGKSIDVYAKFTATEPGTYKIYQYQYIFGTVDGVELGNNGAIEFVLTEDNLVKVFKVGTVLDGTTKVALAIEKIEDKPDTPDIGGDSEASTSGSFTGTTDSVEGIFIHKVNLAEDGLYVFTPTEYAVDAMDGFAPLLLVSVNGEDFELFDGILEAPAGEYYIAVVFVPDQTVTITYTVYDFSTPIVESTVNSEGFGEFTVEIPVDGTYVFDMAGYNVTEDLPYAPIIIFGEELVTGDIYLTAGTYTFTVFSLNPDTQFMIVWYQLVNGTPDEPGEEEPSTSGSFTGTTDSVEGIFIQKVVLPEDGLYVFTPTEYAVDVMDGFAPLLLVSVNGEDFELFDGILEAPAGEYYIAVVFVPDQTVTITYTVYDFSTPIVESTVNSEGFGEFTVEIPVDGTYVFDMAGYNVTEDLPYAPIIIFGEELVTGDIYLTAGTYTFTVFSLTPDTQFMIVWYQLATGETPEGPEQGGDEPEHTHDYVASVTAPTCTEDGYTTYTCACGDSYTADPVEALGHTEGAAATCTTAQICTECGATLVEATGHNHEAVVTAPTCTEDGYTTYTCACGDTYVADTVTAAGHSYDAVVTAPTCTEDGYTTYTCACGDTYVADTVTAAGHAPVDSYYRAEDDGLYLITDDCANCAEETKTPVTENNVPVANEKDLKTVLYAGYSVVLTENINLTSSITLSGADIDVDINLGGKTITADWADEEGVVEVLYILNGASANIYGDGAMISGNQAATNSVISVVGGTVNIYGGSFTSLSYGDVLFVRDDEAGNDGVANIYGGRFEAKEAYYGSYYVLDLSEDRPHLLGEIKVYGGEFVNFDPANHTIDGTLSTDKVAAGYHSIADGNVYTVSAHVWSDATCTAPKTCICGATDGEALEHSWTDATCTAPKTCSGCGATEGEALGHSYEAKVTAPTCTKAGYTTHTCACGDSYTTDEVPAKGHNDENGDFKCDACSTKMLPKDGAALTVKDAIAVAQLAGTAYTTQKYYITGIITGLYNTTYGNFYIEDANGNKLGIYGLYSADGNTRYDAMSYKPVNGDEVTVYTILGTYNSASQGKNAWLDEVIPHEHDYSVTVTNPTCTDEGYTTHTCTICDAYYVDSEVAALGHTTDNGVCEECGQTIGGDAPTYTTHTADFNTVTSTNTSYVKSTTTSGWVATNCAVVKGGTSNSSPAFVALGAAANRGFVMNGKTSAKGSIVSSTISGGISRLKFSYANVFSESHGVDITVTIKQNGTVVATKRIDNNSVTIYNAYTVEWNLADEGIAVSGDFTIEFTNNSPSNSTKNKDRVAIFNVEWTDNPTA